MSALQIAFRCYFEPKKCELRLIGVAVISDKTIHEPVLPLSER
jgi:hypothetical protein